jgi:alcohol dehydrogenase
LAYAQAAACLSGQTLPASDMTGHDLASAARAAVDLVCELQTSIGIRTTLHELGLARNDIPQVAEKAFNIRRLMDLNAKPPTLNDLVQILESAYQ